MSLAADYYDGRSSRRHAVRLQLEPAGLRIEGEGIDRIEPWSLVRIGERLGRAPRRLELAGGACCEVADHAALEAGLKPLGLAEARLVSAQFSPAAIAGALLLVLVAGALFWWQGIPRVSDAIADRLPPALAQQLSDQALEWLDEHGVGSTQLPAARQAELQARYQALRLPGADQRRATLAFRAGGKLGANALTLPDGRILLFDELVGLAANDDDVIAVIGHELGHAQGRHGLQLLVRHTLVAAIAAWWFGDVSSLLAAAPALVAGARYSQKLERAADDYAVALLRANGIPPSRLADMLARLEAEHRKHRGDAPDWADYLASHPSSEERIRRIRGSD